MNISGLNHATVLAALYNNAKVQGMGFLQADNKVMTSEEAQALLDEGGDKPYFDYLKGRVMKIRIEDELNTRLYNRDNGPDAAERVIERLIEQGT